VTARRHQPVIRPARSEDEHAIGALHVACFDDLFAGLLVDCLPPADERAERERSWTGPIGCPRDRHALLVAERVARVCGFVAVGPTRDADGDRETRGELRTVMVADDERAMGVGRALLGAAERAMRDHGFSSATLWVVPQNASAVRCYERCGWHGDGSDNLITVSGHDVRAVRYHKQLAP